jgi:hypothetical protein
MGSLRAWPLAHPEIRTPSHALTHVLTHALTHSECLLFLPNTEKHVDIMSGYQVCYYYLSDLLKQ